MIEVVLDAELAADHFGHPPGCPDLTPKAERLGPAGQQHRQLGKLLRRESRRWTRWWAVPQRRDPTLPATADPLTDGPLGHPQRCGNGALVPSLLLQVPGAQSSPLAPVLSNWSSISHTSLACTSRAFSISPGDL